MRKGISITTSTISGRRIRLRELRVVDVAGIFACIREPQFDYPLMTGTPDPVRHPLHPLRRAIYYASVCKAGNTFGSLLFGQRRHWIVSILDEIEGTFLGGVMVLEVMRDGGRAWGARLGDSFLKHPERRLPIKVGDSELGLFLHPQARGQGIALQAAYVLLDRLSSQREPESKPIVRRVWAETGANNGPAQGLLRKMGFIERPEFAVPPAL